MFASFLALVAHILSKLLSSEITDILCLIATMFLFVFVFIYNYIVQSMTAEQSNMILSHQAKLYKLLAVCWRYNQYWPLDRWPVKVETTENIACHNLWLSRYLRDCTIFHHYSWLTIGAPLTIAQGLLIWWMMNSEYWVLECVESPTAVAKNNKQNALC